ncbi:MAG: hypothetical protein KF862_04425 [Chitinophagaceae bacterium]|nr:hypothetical protein [Chitinophagaceae bacterium]
MIRNKGMEIQHDEEDYEWTEEELIYKRSGSKRKTIAGLFPLVTESFVPETIKTINYFLHLGIQTPYKHL